jgi:lipopolysaccharide export LptBFGC system permease protein LptF
MSSVILFGMSEPSIWGWVLVYLIIGLIGFSLSYIHRYLIFAVVPIFIWLSYYLVNDFSKYFFSQTEKNLAYVLILFDISAIIFGSVLSWKKHKIELKNLK